MKKNGTVMKPAGRSEANGCWTDERLHALIKKALGAPGDPVTAEHGGYRVIALFCSGLALIGVSVYTGGRRVGLVNVTAGDFTAKTPLGGAKVREILGLTVENSGSAV